MQQTYHRNESRNPQSPYLTFLFAYSLEIFFDTGRLATQGVQFVRPQRSDGGDVDVELSDATPIAVECSYRRYAQTLRLSQDQGILG